MSDHLHALIRGEALRALSWSLPNPLSEIILASHMESLGFAISDNELAAHMRYLREKGYVSSEFVQDRHAQRWMHTLSSKGTDLIEGNIAGDPGIKTPRVA